VLTSENPHQEFQRHMQKMLDGANWAFLLMAGNGK